MLINAECYQSNNDSIDPTECLGIIIRAALRAIELETKAIFLGEKTLKREKILIFDFFDNFKFYV